jgi:putative flippase GtrA
MRAQVHPTAWGRWLTFNGIGLLGMALQLTILGILTRTLEVHYLVATAIAVEATVLHNFVWHQRWTWRDRPTGSLRGSASRLARFHALNGSVSLFGNLAMMTLLVGHSGAHAGRGGAIDPIPANIIAVAVCSLLNFAGSHLLVFASNRPRVSRAIATAAVGSIVLIAPVGASSSTDSPTLQAATLSAWQSYEKQVDERYQRPAGTTFFAGDAFHVSSWRNEAAAGRTPMFQLRSPMPGGAEPDVPDGRIHHWVGAIFVPGITVDEVVRYLVSHAGQEAGSYDDVIASRLIARDGEHLRVFLKLRRTKVITATYNTEHNVEYRHLGGQRAMSRSIAARIAELADAGTPAEHEKPVGADSGYLWRLNAYWRYEQSNGGVLIECESVSLSRNIPTLLRPFISGVVEGVARDSLERTLVSLRRVLTRS